MEKVRSWHKAQRRIIGLAEKARLSQHIERMAIGHVNARDQARSFQVHVSQVLPCPDEVIFTELNPVLSPQSGAGPIGVAFVTAG